MITDESFGAWVDGRLTNLSAHAAAAVVTADNLDAYIAADPDNLAIIAACTQDDAVIDAIYERHLNSRSERVLLRRKKLPARVFMQLVARRAGKPLPKTLLQPYARMAARLGLTITQTTPDLVNSVYLNHIDRNLVIGISPTHWISVLTTPYATDAWSGRHWYVFTTNISADALLRHITTPEDRHAVLVRANRGLLEYGFPYRLWLPTDVDMATLDDIDAILVELIAHTQWKRARDTYHKRRGQITMLRSKHASRS